LDGTNGFVRSAAGLLNHCRAFTLSGWVKRAGPQALRAGLFGQNDLLECGYVEDNLLFARHPASGTNVTSTNAFLTGAWNHVAVVVSATNLLLYTNAALAASADFSSAAAVSNAYPFSLGGGVFDATGGFFKGALDEVAVFDRALSFEQLAAHYFSAVSAPPRVTVQPPPTANVYAGDTLLLQVTAVGPSPLRFQWHRDAILLVDQTNASLLVPSLTDAGAGAYFCRVTNAYGSTLSATCLVTVLPAIPPALITHPQPVTTYAGFTATFGVTAIGPRLSYQWQTNRVDLPGANESRLVITNVQATDATAYRVVVTNSLGAAISAEANLTVLAPATSSFAARVVALRPRAYWRLHEPSGPDAWDFAGGHHASAVGPVEFGMAGPIPPSFPGFDADNRAVRFDGADTWLAISSPLLNGQSNFTLLGWINLVGLPADSTGVWGQREVVAFGFSDETTLDVWSPRGGQVSANWFGATNEWHFVALVGTGSDLRLYVDGTLAAVGGSPASDYGASDFNFSLGGGGVFDDLDLNFSGLLDEVAFFPRALTAGEVCGLWCAALQRPLRLSIGHPPPASSPRATEPVVTLSWPCGQLQQADELRDDPKLIQWRNVPDAASPYSVPARAAARFYRLGDGAPAAGPGSA
jgi:hypothetical protein